MYKLLDINQVKYAIIIEAFDINHNYIDREECFYTSLESATKAFNINKSQINSTIFHGTLTANLIKPSIEDFEIEANHEYWLKQWTPIDTYEVTKK